MKSELLHSLLIDVRDQGSVRIDKKKLMWMLGRFNESKTVWIGLIEEWQEIAGKKAPLFGFEWNQQIILTVDAPDNIGERWTA